MTPLSSLTVHTAAAAIPMPGEDSCATLNMIASVGELGVLVALKTCMGRIVDGRLRFVAAKANGLLQVPTEEILEADVMSVVLHSLLARRHYSKSALAYLSLPVIEPALAESRRRRLENLKIGVNPSKPRSSVNPTIGNSAEEIAKNLGICRELFFQAIEIRKKFQANPSIRSEWEPKILSGEMGLGQVQQAIAGKIAGHEGKTVPKNDAEQLMLDLFDTAEHRFGRWDKLGQAQRSKAVEKFRTKFLPNLPEELLEAAEEFIDSRRATDWIWV